MKPRVTKMKVLVQKNSAVRFSYGYESGGIPMGSQNSIGENSTSQVNMPQINQMGGNMFSKEYYDQIVKLFSQVNTNPSTIVSANVAGIVS